MQWFPEASVEVSHILFVYLKSETLSDGEWRLHQRQLQKSLESLVSELPSVAIDPPLVCKDLYDHVELQRLRNRLYRFYGGPILSSLDAVALIKSWATAHGPKIGQPDRCVLFHEDMFPQGANRFALLRRLESDLAWHYFVPVLACRSLSPNIRSDAFAAGFAVVVAIDDRETFASHVTTELQREYSRSVRLLARRSMMAGYLILTLIGSTIIVRIAQRVVDSFFLPA